MTAQRLRNIMENKWVVITAHHQAQQVYSFEKNLPSDWKLLVVCSSGDLVGLSSLRTTILNVDRDNFWTQAVQIGIDYLGKNESVDILVIANCDVTITGWQFVPLSKYPLRCGLSVTPENYIRKTGFKKRRVPGLHCYPYYKKHFNHLPDGVEVDAIFGRCMILSGQAIDALEVIRLPKNLPHYGADIVFSYQLGKYLSKPWRFDRNIHLIEDMSTSGTKTISISSLATRISAMEDRKSVFNYRDNMAVSRALSDGNFLYLLIARAKYFVRLLRGF